MGMEGRSWECLWSWESRELEKHHQSLAEDLFQASPPTVHTPHVLPPSHLGQIFFFKW